MRRGRTWLIILAILAVLVTVVLVTLPVGVRMFAEARVRAMTGREMTIGDVDLNLFTRRLVVADARVHAEADRPPPLAFERLTVRFEILPLLGGRLHLQALALSGLDVYLERTGPQRFNVSDIAARLAARPAAEPLEIVVDTLRVDGARVRLEDRVVEPSRSWVLADVDLEAHDIATVADAAQGRASATFVLAGAPGVLQVQRLAVRPLQAQGTLTLDGLDLGGLGAYVFDGAAVRPSGGRLTTRLTVAYEADGAVRTGGEASIRELTLARRGQDSPLLSVPVLAATAKDLTYEDGDVTGGRLELVADQAIVLDATAPRARPLDVTALRAAWVRGAEAPPEAPGHLTLRATLPEGGHLVADGTLDPRPLTADLEVELRAVDVGLAQIWIPLDAAISPVSGQLAGTVDLHYAGSDGLRAGAELRVDELALARAGQRPPVLRDERIQATVRDLRVHEGRLAPGRIEVSGSPTLTDASVTPAQSLHLPHLSVIAEGGAMPGGPPSRLRLTTTLPHGGRLQASGTGALAPASLALTVRASDADLALAAPYVPARAPFRLDHGRLDLEASVTWDGALRAEGRVVAHDLTVLRRGQAEPFLHHPSLEGTVAGLVLRDGQLVVQQLTLAGAPTLVDGTASPPQRFDVQDLTLAMTDFTWPGRRPARVEGHIQVANGGRGDLAGTLHPGTLATDVRAHFENVDVARAGGYLPSAAPLVVENGRGEVTMHLRHRRADGVQVDAEGAVRAMALRLSAGPGVRVQDEQLAFTVTGLVLHAGATSLDSATLDGTPAIARAGEVSPALSRLHAELRALRWPEGDPATWRLLVEPADGGRLTAQGTLHASSRRVTGTLQAEDAAIAPFAVLVPIDAPIAGRLDARLRGAAGAQQPVVLAGGLTLRELRIGPLDAPPVRVERIEITEASLEGSRLTIPRLVVDKPQVVVERERDGAFLLRAMLTPESPAASPGPAARRVEPAAATDPGPELVVTIEELALREGNVRFIDRTTTPAYSEELSRLTVTVRHLTNASDGRATVSAQGIVGVDAALELQGQVAPFDRPFFLDVRGELRSFAVPRTNPYLQRFLDWIARRGQLTTRVHYRIAGGELTATNEVVVQRLDVEPADGDPRPDRLVGLPLGLVVALLKDARGEIHVTVPVSGEVRSPKFSFGDAIRRAFKNVLARAVTSPFRAIGSIFRRGDDGRVEDVVIEPVTFEPGSAVLSPEAATHLQRVADFLRASPYVWLTLQPATSEEDLRALRAQEVTARIQRVQREQGIANFAEAARHVWQAARPDRASPEDPRAIVRALAEQEPTPTEAARRLAERRVGVTRTQLVDAAGIPRERLLDTPGSPVAGAGAEGSVQFGLRPAS